VSVPQIVMAGDSPRARLFDPVESHEAADASTTSVAASQAAVLAVLEFGIALTDKQIVVEIRRTGQRFSDSRVRSARSELERDGRVHKAGRVKQDGVHASVWRIGPALPYQARVEDIHDRLTAAGLTRTDQQISTAITNAWDSYRDRHDTEPDLDIEDARRPNTWPDLLWEIFDSLEVDFEENRLYDRMGGDPL
jgi:hypothetical protein